MFERSRKVLDEMEKYDFEHERVIIFITDGRVQASEKQVKYEDTMKVRSSGLYEQGREVFMQARCASFCLKHPISRRLQ